MASCAGCPHDYFFTIAKYYEKNQESLEYFRDHGVLAKEVTCGKCGGACVLRQDRYQWRCCSSRVLPKTKKRRYCDFIIGDYKGTFLQETRLPPWKVILFVNEWIRKSWRQETAVECLNISRTTCIAWTAHCSEVTKYWLTLQEGIGGAGLTVEISQTVIVKRKSERGRVWAQLSLFGGVERGSKKHFIVPLVGPLGEADGATLIPLIQRYIRPGSTIISAPCGAEDTLRGLDYTFRSTQPSEHPASTSRSDVHTRNIERLWKGLKEWVKQPGVRGRSLLQHLSRHLFLKAHTHSEVLHAFFTTAGQLYPPQSDQHRSLSLDDDSDNDESL